MLQEVKSTLGTVTERLQQILRTVRRDPANAEITRVDLAALVAESRSGPGRRWAARSGSSRSRRTCRPSRCGSTATCRTCSRRSRTSSSTPATRPSRCGTTCATRRSANPTRQSARQKLLDAAAWRGEVALRARRDGDRVVLEVRDNGIGMTEEVRRNCLKTHFTTKRDNALYEGYSAGWGSACRSWRWCWNTTGRNSRSSPPRCAARRSACRLPLADDRK